MKILLQTAHKLLREADDIWIDNQSCSYILSLGLPTEELFIESTWEDPSGLVFEYSANGDDNATVELDGTTITLVGRSEDNESYEFEVTLLKKWNAEEHLGRCFE